MNSKSTTRDLLLQNLQSMAALEQDVKSIIKKQDDFEMRLSSLDKNLTINTALSQELRKKVDDLKPVQEAYTKAQGIGWFVAKIAIFVAGSIGAVVGLKELYEFITRN